MTSLVGFLDILLRGLGLVAFSVAVGGVAFALLVLRLVAQPSSLGWGARARALRFIVWGGLGVALTEGSRLGLKPWALADAGRPWPIWEFLGTEFGTGSDP